jgi:hypothetical protein
VLHRHAWLDAIIGAASLAFTGLTFILSFLLANLFDAIGISLLKDLLDKGWFGWTLAGTAFGGASAILRERDALIATLQRLAQLVFSVLSPVLAGALALFLVALPATGFAGLWKSGLPETPLLLSAAAFAVLFLNAIIGDSPDDRAKGRLWRVTELVLLLAVLPLATLALVSMSMRVGQYGWTPERLWGVLASIIAMIYGAAAWFAAFRGGRDFDVPLRQYQKYLAVGLACLALFLALPIVDFGSISTRSQLARFDHGKVEASQFDWSALAFDFGPSGRRALERLSHSGNQTTRDFAARALASENRWGVAQATRVAEEAHDIASALRVVGPDIPLTEDLRRVIAGRTDCSSAQPCVVLRVDGQRVALVSANGGRMSSQLIELKDVAEEARTNAQPVTEEAPSPVATDLTHAMIEIRDVARKQLYVDGKPVGAPFE